MIDRVLRVTDHQPVAESTEPEAVSSSAAAASLDPAVLLALADRAVRQMATDSARGTVREAHARAQNDLAEQRRAIEAARQAAHKAHSSFGFGSLFGLVSKIVGLIAGAAAVAATGGGAVALTGLALTLFGNDIAAQLAEAGVISKEDAAKLGMGLQLTGSLVLGFGAAGGAAVTASSLRIAASTVQGSATIAAGGTQIASAVTNGIGASYVRQSEDWQADAQEWGVEADRQQTRQDDAVDEIRKQMEAMRRGMERVADMVEAQHQTRRAALRVLA